MEDYKAYPSKLHFLHSCLNCHVVRSLGIRLSHDCVKKLIAEIENVSNKEIEAILKEIEDNEQSS